MERQFTIIGGDSGTGKTHLLNIIREYQTNGKESGVDVTIYKDEPLPKVGDNESEIGEREPIRRLDSDNGKWKDALKDLTNHIFFIDETDMFLETPKFHELAYYSDNYFVIVARKHLGHIPYSVDSMYELVQENPKEGDSTTVNKMKKMYKHTIINFKPDLILTEDSKAGYKFYDNVFTCRCETAQGKDNIRTELEKWSKKYDNIFVVVDGAGFGASIERLYNTIDERVRKDCRVEVFAPESFEYILLRGMLHRLPITPEEVLKPYDYCDTLDYNGWEPYFTDLLIGSTKRLRCMKYTKSGTEGRVYYTSRVGVQEILKGIQDIDVSLIHADYK